MPIEQIPLSQWPYGLDRDAAYVDLTPEMLTDHLGLCFESGTDGLGDFDAAIIVLRDGPRFAIQHHHHAPVSGIKILLERAEFDAETLRRGLRRLGIGKSQLLWKSPALSPPAYPPLIPRTKPAAGTGLILKLRETGKASVRRKQLLPRADRPRRPLHGTLTGRHTGHRA